MAEADEEDDRKLLGQCLQEQVSELRLLTSMYNVPEELQFATTDGVHSDLVSQLLNADMDEVPSDLGCFVDEFSLKLKDLTDDTPIELTFHFSPRYPRADPLTVYVRCPNLDRQQSCLLNSALRHHLEDSLPLGEPRVTDAIAWIRDHFDEFRSLSKVSDSSASTTPTRKSAPQRFQRLWLYSHHIYSKFKRKDIVALAAQLDLTGFSMPGKPGVVCVEGSEENCQEFWETVKTWTWKKIAIRHQESIDLRGDATDGRNADDRLKASRKFGPLKEVGFDVRHGGGREFHMDMAGFNKFLTEHDCGQMFSLLFGIDHANGTE